MVELKSGNSKVGIDQGELVSFVVEGHEYIHQKGSPGWRSSDTEMFPIIGPVDQAGFRVNVPNGEAIQDQHGLLRELEYVLLESTESTAQFQKEYKAGTSIKNSKFPEKSDKQWLTWPYSFIFQKSFELKDNRLTISFKITGERDMPFMLGYHPAFKIHTNDSRIITDDKDFSLDEVLAVGSRALQVADCTSIVLKDKKEIQIDTEGFGHFMCWTEVRNMVCIEPISFYPYSVEQQNLHEGFQLLEDEANFEVTLTAKI
ncbi:aldose 1-epimerase [Flagellimonas nanhaiensis]|uniref:Aldose 1-epimerase n=1 Tax=Flagellimonas nanhaiensis TaxID=2292706 RepID=A0A371JSH4_9FLAO|nr:aldose 1-epimerase [Allomuricauda nanhaiensis]RDY60751.1 aldose 1-epimerase [Allomuricauda nanhaiensis]